MQSGSSNLGGMILGQGNQMNPQVGVQSNQNLIGMQGNQNNQSMSHLQAQLRGKLNDQYPAQNQQLLQNDNFGGNMI